MCKSCFYFALDFSQMTLKQFEFRIQHFQLIICSWKITHYFCLSLFQHIPFFTSIKFTMTSAPLMSTGNTFQIMMRLIHNTLQTFMLTILTSNQRRETVINNKFSLFRLNNMPIMWIFWGVLWTIISMMLQHNKRKMMTEKAGTYPGDQCSLCLLTMKAWKRGR